MPSRGIALLDRDSGREDVKRACREAKIKVGLIEALIDAELEQVGKLRKRGLNDRFDEILGEFLGEEGE